MAKDLDFEHFILRWKDHAQCSLRGPEIHLEARLSQLKLFMIEFPIADFPLDTTCSRAEQLSSKFLKRFYQGDERHVKPKSLKAKVYIYFMLCLLFPTSSRCIFSSSLEASRETLTTTFSLLKDIIDHGLRLHKIANQYSSIQTVLRNSMSWVLRFCIEVVRHDLNTYLRDDMEGLLPAEYQKIFHFIYGKIYLMKHPIEVGRGMLSAVRHKCRSWIDLFDRFEKVADEVYFLGPARETVCGLCHATIDCLENKRPFAILDSCCDIFCVVCIRKHLGRKLIGSSCPTCQNHIRVWAPNCMYLLHRMILHPRKTELNKNTNKPLNVRIGDTSGSTYHGTRKSGISRLTTDTPSYSTSSQISSSPNQRHLLPTYNELHSTVSAGSFNVSSSSQECNDFQNRSPFAPSKNTASAGPSNSTYHSSNQSCTNQHVDSTCSSDTVNSLNLSGSSIGRTADVSDQSQNHIEMPDSRAYSNWFSLFEEFLRNRKQIYTVFCTVRDVMWPDVDFPLDQYNYKNSSNAASVKFDFDLIQGMFDN